MRPLKKPVSPGDTCWNSEFANDMLSPIAKVGVAHSDWFLATHSPISCAGATGVLSEGDVFQRLFNAGSEYLVVIKGEPGSGKSQLINWLQLRFESELAHSERPTHRSSQLRAVMIKRRSGSLKDALHQLVEQLPGYERYLADVTSAISELSSDEARRKLSFAISGVLRSERSLAPTQLALLYQLFHDVRCIEWMCRPGGAIDKNISRLTTASDPSDPESLPQFSADEFLIRNRMGSAVDGLLLDLLEEEPELREQAAVLVNCHLRRAIAELTGLRGQTLHEVFRNIRLEMKRNGEELALFVEDVSTLSVLDEELVNALEPQNDPRLCGLLSVLGMTIPAFERLPDNLKQRIDLGLELRGDAIGQNLSTDFDYADRFAARYLNALRVGHAALPQLAQGRRQNGDALQSACTDCALRSNCFEAFGSVAFGEEQVGLYPLASGTASRLLKGLSAAGAARNPRALLQKVVRPLLDTISRNFSHSGANVGLDVVPQSPSDFGVRKGALLGGWSPVQQGRLSYLTWYWTGAETLDAGAGSLKPMLPWFALPAFSATVQPVTPKPPINPSDAEPQPPVQLPAAYGKANQRLDAWFLQSHQLEGDSEFRELLLKVVKQSLPLETYRQPSHAMRQRAVSTALSTTNIAIEGMVAKPRAGTKARFNFPRDQQTYDVLKALLDYTYRGASSWNFDGSETHRRTYGKWLRLRQDELVRSYQVVETDPRLAQRVAIRYLVMAYRFCERKALPSDTSASISILLSFAPTEPATLSEDAQRLAADVKSRVDKIRTFLWNELNVPQGTGSSVNFIDPLVILSSLTSDESDIGLPAFEGDQARADYPEIWQLVQSHWRDLTVPLEAEHRELVGRLEECRKVLRRWDIGTSVMIDGLRSFFEGARAVVQACTAANHTIGDTDLQRRIAAMAPAEVSRQISPIDGVAVVEQSGPLSMLTIDVGSFDRLSKLVQEVDAAMSRLVKTLDAKLDGVITETDVALERTRAMQALQQLGALTDAAMTPDQALPDEAVDGK